MAWLMKEIIACNDRPMPGQYEATQSTRGETYCASWCRHVVCDAEYDAALRGVQDGLVKRYLSVSA